MADPKIKGPLLVCATLVIAGLLIAAIGGLTKGSIVGGVVAASGAIPAIYAAWKGMQQETQAGLAAALGALLVAVGVGGLLILLRIFDWFR
jgi:hypothetical protein